MQRNTTQRDAIRSALAKAGRPLSPQEVLNEAQKRVPRLGVATVYRTIKSLLDERFIAEVQVPGESPRYELAGLAHHHHFHCRACGRVYDVPGCPGKIKDLAPRGFVVESHELVLFGTCPGCSKQRSNICK